MMMRFTLLLLTISFIRIKVVGAKFLCPTYSPCYCFESTPDEFRVHCTTNATIDVGFDLVINPNELTRIQCRGMPDWNDFLLGSSMNLGSTKRLIVSTCKPPGDGSLVTKHLGLENVEYLKFEGLRGPLTARDLDVFPELKYLVLSNNYLNQVDPHLLRGLGYLKQLELRNTNIDVPTGFFDNASSLKILELSGNKLKTLRPEIFRGLKSIELLNLWKNEFRKLDTSLFSNLSTLVSLDIHQNSLRTLPKDIFKDLVNLEVINFSSNNFTSLPVDLFRYNKKLKFVKLLYNRANLTNLPSGLLANLVDLKVVSFMRSKLLSVPENLIWDSTSVVELNLNGNYLTSLPDNFLKDAMELHTFTLSYNDLKLLPDGFFRNAKKLAKLNLSGNRLTSITERTLLGLESLQELYIENNDLSFIHVDAFMSLGELKIAKLTNNKLTLNTHLHDMFGPVSPFHPCGSLEELHLSHNNVSQMYSDWVISNTRLRTLDLSYNSFYYIEAEDLQFMSNVDVDLRYNSITLVNLTRLEYIASNQKKGSSRNVTINLDFNPIQCDCEVYSLLRYLDGEMRVEALNYVQLDTDDIICNGPEYTSGSRLTELRASQLKCLVKTEYSGDPCAPEAVCDCWLKPADELLILDCADRNLTVAPEQIHARGVKQVELDLSSNELEAAPDIRANGYEKVRTLNLAGNRIRFIDENLISPNLEVLKLEGNNLTTIDSKVLNILANSSRIAKVTLHDNPWLCDCSAQELFSFIKSNFLKFPELLNVSCANDNTSLSNLSIDDLCPSSNVTLVIGCSVISILGLLFGCIAALYFRFQQEIKVWLYSKSMCLCLVTEEEIDRDKTYDAFISYSHKDEDFVIKELVTKLEDESNPYKICIHTRDWLAGEWIPAQIARSVEESRRTIVVLTPNFVESVWGRLEFQAAHKQALSEKRARVIVVVYGEIGPTDNLDPELRAYLQMNTYVKWGDPWFWQKLRYAMPHTVRGPNKTNQRKVENITIVSKAINQGKIENSKIVYENEKNKQMLEIEREINGNHGDKWCLSA